ncbi:hypothetical protein [Streptomyces sp. BP-8]|uniref:hypothetical protein n=1 Tax=Streptomyces sirii TaxID=3127701 RepID=UPI00388E59FA
MLSCAERFQRIGELSQAVTADQAGAVVGFADGCQVWEAVLGAAAVDLPGPQDRVGAGGPVGRVGVVLRFGADGAVAPFDLVLAGGLFDYLEERFTRALIRTTLSRLCRPGDTFHFSNIATPNPYAALMTHIGRWNHVERTPADIEADVRAAAPPGRNRRRTGHHRRCHRPDAFRDGAAR